MSVSYANLVKKSHLRFVFTDAVVSLPLADDATFQDVAHTFRDLSRMNLGDVVSIVAVLKANDGSSAGAMTA